MRGFPEPSAANDFLAPHVARLLRSYMHWLGQPLLDGFHTASEQARQIFAAPFVVVSHDVAPAPIFTYGNRTALALFGLSWTEFTALPSYQSAEATHQTDRERLLTTVAEQGYATSYSGVRIAKNGQRFRIHNVTMWNVLDESGGVCGQAALYADWTFLE